MELFAESPKTTKHVADLLGQPPTRLYHHVAALERAGLLVLQSTRQNRGAVEKWYVGVARHQMDGPATPPRGGSERSRRQARRAVAATALEQAKQEVIAIPAGATEPALVTRLVLVAPTSQIAALRARLIETVKGLRTELQTEDAAADTTDCERWALTLAFAPVAPPRRRRSRQ